MLRKTLTIITLAAFAFANVAPAALAGAALAGPSLIPGPRSGTYDLHKKSARIIGGAYVRVPFTGGLKRNQIEEPRFGLAMAANFNGRQGNKFSFASGTAPRVLDLSLGLSSLRGQNAFRNTLRFNGMTFADSGMLYADEEGENGKKKGKAGKAAGTGLAIIGGLALVFAGVGVIVLLSEPKAPESDFDFDFCF